MAIKIGIFLFDDVEILDFTGPYEAFSAARISIKNLNKKNIEEIYKTPSPFEIITFSFKKKILTSGGLNVICNYNLSDIPKIDILLIPGGKGTRKLLKNMSLISWLKNIKDVNLIMSVCTGSLLLAAAGLLKNTSAATHWSAVNLLKKISPSTNVVKDRYVLDNIYTSSGVSSGIDLSLKVIEIYFGKIVAKNTAKYMEYKTIDIKR